MRPGAICPAVTARALAPLDAKARRENAPSGINRDRSGCLPLSPQTAKSVKYMPEFEEPEAKPNNVQNYTPSTDARPRTRRRSGGFKTEPAQVNYNIGEVDPVKALKGEKLSGSAKSEAPAARAERAPRAERSARPPRTERPERRSPDSAPAETPSTSQAAPSAATLEAIQRVEARIEARRAERGPRRNDREKKPKADATERPNRATAKKPAPKQGLIGSILAFFGLGAKQPARKPMASKNTSRKPNGRTDGPRGRDADNRKGSGDRPRRSNNGGDRRRKGGGQGGRRRNGGGNRNSQNSNNAS